MIQFLIIDHIILYSLYELSIITLIIKKVIPPSLSHKVSKNFRRGASPVISKVYIKEYFQHTWSSITKTRSRAGTVAKNRSGKTAHSDS